MTTERICPACGWARTAWQHRVTCNPKAAPAVPIPVVAIPAAEGDAGEHRCPVCNLLHWPRPLTGAERQRAYRERRRTRGRG